MECSYNQYSLQIVKSHSKKLIDLNWNKLFEESEKAKATKKFIMNTADAQMWWNAWEPTFFSTQLITGHGCIMSHLHRMKITKSNKYFCGQIQDQDHLLYHYALTKEIRIKIYKKGEKSKK